MITKEQLKPGMIFKYNGRSDGEHPLSLIVEKMTDKGPDVRNYKANNSYGVLMTYGFFHKWNTPKEQVSKAVTEIYHGRNSLYARR